MAVRAGEYESSRTGVLPEAFRVFQKPGPVGVVLRHEPQPAAGPASSLRPKPTGRDRSSVRHGGPGYAAVAMTTVA